MSKVTANQIAASLAEGHGLRKGKAREFINAFFAEVSAALGSGEDVSIAGIGSFRGVFVKPRKAERRKNPFAPGKMMEVSARPASVKVKFTASKALKEEASRSLATRRKAANAK